MKTASLKRQLGHHRLGCCEAEQLLREKINLCEDLYGTTAAVVLAYLEDLAILLEKGGRLEESESLFKRVLASRRSRALETRLRAVARRALGLEHEDTLRCGAFRWPLISSGKRSMSNLAVCLERRGHLEEVGPRRVDVSTCLGVGVEASQAVPRGQGQGQSS